MKTQRFSTEQIVSVLRQADMGLPVKDLIRQIGITEQTFYRWKRQSSGLKSDQVREFKQVVEENARLKRLVAELTALRIMSAALALSGAATSLATTASGFGTVMRRSTITTLSLPELKPFTERCPLSSVAT